MGGSNCPRCGSELARRGHTTYCSNPLCNYDEPRRSQRWEGGLVLGAGILTLLLGFAVIGLNAILGISMVLLGIVFAALSFDIKKEISRVIIKRKKTTFQIKRN
ncbi:MAG: hypothetical protein ACE5KG_07235 [Nitrososphaerales archaeon]